MKRTYGWMSSWRNTTSGECLNGRRTQNWWDCLGGQEWTNRSSGLQEQKSWVHLDHKMNTFPHCMLPHIYLNRKPVFLYLLHSGSVGKCNWKYVWGCMEEESYKSCSQTAAAVLTSSEKSKGLALSPAVALNRARPRSSWSATVCCFLPLLTDSLRHLCREQDRPQPQTCCRCDTIMHNAASVDFITKQHHKPEHGSDRVTCFLECFPHPAVCWLWSWWSRSPVHWLSPCWGRVSLNLSERQVVVNLPLLQGLKLWVACESYLRLVTWEVEFLFQLSIWFYQSY